MSSVTVTNQTELDTAIADNTEEITIRSDKRVRLTIGDTRNSHVIITGQTYVRECSGSVEWVTDSGRVGEVTGSGSVERVTDSGVRRGRWNVSAKLTSLATRW